MFVNASCYGEDVRVKDDVIGIEVNFSDQQLIGSCADLNLTICVRCLQVTNGLFKGFIRNIFMSNTATPVKQLPLNSGHCKISS